MKRAVFLAGFLLAAQFLFAQSPRPAFPLIAENPDRAACNMHSYEFGSIVDTPAPEGFVPVYISHYGRHGSRHDISASAFQDAIQLLSRADSLGQLTEAGKTLLCQVKAVAEEHEGMGGELTLRGGREHQRLARRMVGRFPSVFTEGEKVQAMASTVQRCIVSMANFMAALKGEVPQIDVEMMTGERYSPVVRPGGSGTPDPGRRPAGSKDGLKGGGPGPRKQGPLQGDYSAFLAKVLVSPDLAAADRDALVRGVFKAGGLCQDLDFLDMDIFRNYFTTEELYSLWEQENESLYKRWGNSLESGGSYGQKALPLLQDIITKAEDALIGTDMAADLRFGHDMGYMALCNLLGIATRDGGSYSVSEAAQHWFSFDIVPMAANIQLVLYRNASERVLVKVLRNEEEVLIPGLSPVGGPYYDWSDFKNKFVDLP